MQNFLSCSFAKEYMYRILVEIEREKQKDLGNQCTYDEYKFLITELLLKLKSE